MQELNDDLDESYHFFELINLFLEIHTQHPQKLRGIYDDCMLFLFSNRKSYRKNVVSIVSNFYPVLNETAEAQTDHSWGLGPKVDPYFDLILRG